MRLEVFRSKVASEPLDQLAVLANEELLKVPCDIRASHGRPQCHCARIKGTAGEDERVFVAAAVALAVASGGVIGEGPALFHPFEEGKLLGAVDFGAFEKLALKLEAVARAHVLKCVEELVVVFVGLVAELVAGDGKYRELVAVGLFQLLVSSVRSISITSM